MTYKMIYVDMDGTLLNSKKEISDKNRSIIKALGDKGIIFGIATGRIYPAAKAYAKELGINSPIICCNGALIVDPRNDNPVISNKLSGDTVKKVIQIAKENSVYYHYYTKDTIYAEEEKFIAKYFKEFSKDKPEDEKVKTVISADIIDNVDELEIYKVGIFVDDSEQSIIMTKKIKEIEGISAYKSLDNLFDIVPDGVDKGSALEQLGELLNVKREEIMAIGDNENDINMLKYAGMGIAMENSEDQIKEISDYVTSNNDEDGVYHGIVKFIEIEAAE